RFPARQPGWHAFAAPSRSGRTPTTARAAIAWHATRRSPGPQPISRTLVHGLIDRVGNELDAPITVQHIATGLVSTAEPISILQAAPISYRRIRCTPDHAVIHADEHRFIIALVILRIVAGGIEVLFAIQVGVARPIRDVGNPDLTPLERDTGQVL